VIGVLLISHGAIGETLLASAEQILGAKQSQVAALGVSRNDDPGRCWRARASSLRSSTTARACWC